MTSPSDRAQIAAWLRQASADLSASRVSAPGILECHQRYWLQQSYEKTIKAFALKIWSWHDAARNPAERQQDIQQPGTREADTRRKFFKEHSPIHAMEANNYHASASLSALTRQIKTFLKRRLGPANYSNILCIDRTIPSINPVNVSYRYPFQPDGEYIAPADYPSKDWVTYQGGTIHDLSRSVSHLYTEVYKEFRLLR